MKTANRIVLSAIAAGVMCGTGMANAYEPGQFIGRVGIATVAPDEDSDAIVIPTSPDPTVLPNGVNVDSDTQLGLTGTYMVADHFGIEILAATPYKHTIKLEDADVTAGTT